LIRARATEVRKSSRDRWLDALVILCIALCATFLACLVIALLMPSKSAPTHTHTHSSSLLVSLILYWLFCIPALLVILDDS